LIFSKIENKWGVYAARICWKGVWKEVVIDDFFPVDDKLPIFSHSACDETWVLIMEKAWAKLHGNYAKIDGGFAREPLHDLTGAPSKTYKPDFGKKVDTDKNKYIWKRIKDGEKKDVFLKILIKN
jgi:calpain-15